jgi:hypothetical protein
MNLLVDQLPTAIEIDGREYAIESDFRIGLRIMLAFEDDGLTLEEKYMIMLQNLYQVIPDNSQQAFEVGMRFLNGGKDSETEEEGGGPRLYSFDKDAGLIFAAFKQTHNVDLTADNLHWFSFLALFMDLGQDTTFCQLVALRKRLSDGTATKEDRRMARDMGDLVDVPQPDDRTPEERAKEEEFMQLIKAGK